MCSLGFVDRARAQDPILRVKIEPRSVVVGQPVHVEVTLLVPTWFKKAPVYPDLELKGAVAVLSRERAVNLTERIEGDTWSGMTRTYLIYPQEPRSFTLPPAEVVVVYAVDGTGSSDPVRLTLPPRTFDVTIPDAAIGLDHFVATPHLTLSQHLDRKFEDLMAGDAVVRTITISADRTLGMFLPPISFGEFEGMSVYQEQPQIIDLPPVRGEFKPAKRIETVSYLIRQEGDFELPEVVVYWWDLGAETIRTRTLPAISFHADPNPDVVAEIPPALEATMDPAPVAKEKSLTETLRQWFLPGLLVALVLFVSARFGRRWVHHVAVRRKARRALEAESEAAYFRKFQSACMKNDEAGTMRSLVRWLDRFAPDQRAPLQLLLDAGDAELTQGIRTLEARLYDQSKRDLQREEWTGRKLYPVVVRFRNKNTQTRDSSGSGKEASLPELNPAS